MQVLVEKSVCTDSASTVILAVDPGTAFDGFESTMDRGWSLVRCRRRRRVAGACLGIEACARPAGAGASPVIAGDATGSLYGREHRN